MKTERIPEVLVTGHRPTSLRSYRGSTSERFGASAKFSFQRQGVSRSTPFSDL